MRRNYIRNPERPKIANHISDSALGKFQTIFEKQIYLCPLLYSAPWFRYCSEKDFSLKKCIIIRLKVLAGRENKKLKVSAIYRVGN
jgi:hypothetical protein